MPRREALETRETPYRSVGPLHARPDLRDWWIGRGREEVDPGSKVFPYDDFLPLVRGALRLELRDDRELVLEVGDSFVIPAGTAFRGYRWPRDAGEKPCIFVATSRSDVEATKQPLG